MSLALRSVAFLTVLPLAAALSACSGSSTEPATNGAQGDGPRDTLVIASSSDAASLLSIVSQSSADSAIADQLYFSTFDSDFDCKLTYKPALATSWSFSEDHKKLTVELRSDVTWADGTPVSADDIAFTYKLVGDPRVASPRADYLKRMVPGANPRVVSPTKLEWEFTEAYDETTMLAHVALPPVPKHLLDKPDVDLASLRGHPLASQAPLSSGPWKLTEWKKNEKIVLEGNDKFTGPSEFKPKLKRVIFKVLPEYATRLIELENGSVDLMEGILVKDADKLAKSNPDIVLHRRGWRSMDYVGWNSIDPVDYKAKLSAMKPGEKPSLADVKPHPIFGDKEVRKALTLAVDVNKLIKDLLTSEVNGEVYGRPSTGTITPALCDAHNNDIKPLPYDPTAARKRLEELGWKDSNGDGVLDKGGQDLRFTLLTNSGNPRRAKAAVILQANLKEVGVDMKIEQLEANTFFERLRKKDFEAALSGWSAGLFIDPTSIWGETSEFNSTSYRSEKASALIAQGMKESDPVKAAPIWKELQQVIYDDQPYTFLYWMDEIVGVNNRFEGTRVDILSSYGDLYQWSVPAEKVKYKM